MSALRLLITLRLNPAKMPLISYRENGFLQETRFLGDLILLSRVHHNWRLLGSFEMNYDGIWHHPQTIS